VYLLLRAGTRENGREMRRPYVPGAQAGTTTSHIRTCEARRPQGETESEERWDGAYAIDTASTGHRRGANADAAVSCRLWAPVPRLWAPVPLSVAVASSISSAAD
jgi:hypothetical protein